MTTDDESVYEIISSTLSLLGDNGVCGRLCTLNQPRLGEQLETQVSRTTTMGTGYCTQWNALLQVRADDENGLQ